MSPSFFIFLLVFSLITIKTKSEDDLGEVCYDHLGCFSVRDCPVTGKWVNSLPDKPDNINTTFTLHTLRPHSDANNNADANNTIDGSSDNLVQMDYSDTMISYDNLTTLQAINGSEPIAIIIHGFGNIGKHLPALKDELVKIVPQVVMVDWQRGSRLPYFNYAVVNTQLVGHQIAYLLSLLKSVQGLEYKNVHLIGFSLGAHVAAFAARWLKKTYGGRVGRITALDAASPYFEQTCFHLNYTDADYVDAIHTNAEDKLPRITSRVGSRTPFAHVDFYPNGGRKQPQCEGRWWDLICNHYSSIDFFRASIKFRHICTFSAVKCDKIEDMDSGGCNSGPASAMGYFSKRYNGRGIYYLETFNVQPFCMT